jgi:hypothetical protein
MIPSTHRHQKPTRGKSSLSSVPSPFQSVKELDEMRTDSQLAQPTQDILKLEILGGEAATLVALQRILLGQETTYQEML